MRDGGMVAGPNPEYDEGLQRANALSFQTLADAAITCPPVALGSPACGSGRAAQWELNRRTAEGTSPAKGQINCRHEHSAGLSTAVEWL